MLSPLQIARANTAQRSVVGEVVPTRVIRRNPHEWHIAYSDGAASPPACVRCPDAPCLRFSAEEIALPGFAEFPCDGDLSVCPTGALDWPLDAAGGPSVNAEKCIGCGLCVLRCPVNAIIVQQDGTAKVLDQDTPHLKLSSTGNGVAVRDQFASHVKHRDPIQLETDDAVEQLVSRLREIGSGSGPRFPNLVTRNLLLAVGWHAACRRNGDTNMRIDVLAEQPARLCVTEVEFSDAIIDAPRSVLDGVAVLHGRYAIPKDIITGLICSADLPNQRSEYWQVIADIKDAVGVSVHTVTVPSLVLFVWARAKLTHLPYAAIGQATIRPAIESQLGRAVAISSGVASALEVAK
jgi:Fe-S-cluster-containing hydrogenase component 2